MATVTIFENIYIKDQPNYISVEQALARIRTGRSKVRIDELRNTLDKNKQDYLKKNLPCVCFSGKFEKRFDENIIEHSGYLVLDFDNVEDLGTKAAEISTNGYVAALWVSPRGNGLKCLIKIADGKKHREHFAALKEIFPDVDNSGVNESRVCYESYDPNIYISEKVEPFTKTLTVEKIESREIVTDEQKIFKNLLKWITNKGGAFVSGERNIFIYKLASACCRFGISDQSTQYLILSEYPPSNDFTQKEALNTIKSAYKRNGSIQGSAIFDREILVDKKTRKEIELPKEVPDIDTDIIYGASVKANALNIYKYGYEKVSGIGVPAFDNLFKAKKGEITCLTGIGNYGKSALLKWFFLMRFLIFGDKFGVFSPEDNPPEEYYHDYVEMLLGANCTPYIFDGKKNFDQPGVEAYNNAYDFISNRVFYLYPKYANPTPEYILELFLGTVIKEKITGICIDPYNRLFHDYKQKRQDQYLEQILDMLHRFGQQNDLYNFLVVHPKNMVKEANKNYPCPDVFDLNGGAMWNNKMDNIVVYHRPLGQTDPTNPTAEFHSKKIKRQKSVGKKGFITFEYDARKRRFLFDGRDYLGEILSAHDLSFNKPFDGMLKPVMEQQTKPDNFLAGFQRGSGYNPADWKDWDKQ